MGSIAELMCVDSCIQRRPPTAHSYRPSCHHTCLQRDQVSPTLIEEVLCCTESISAAYLGDTVIFRNLWEQHSFTWRTSCKRSNCQVSPYIQESCLSIWIIRRWDFRQQDQMEATRAWHTLAVMDLCERPILMYTDKLCWFGKVGQSNIFHHGSTGMFCIGWNKLTYHACSFFVGMLRTYMIHDMSILFFNHKKTKCRTCEYPTCWSKLTWVSSLQWSVWPCDDRYLQFTCVSPIWLDRREALPGSLI